MARTKRSLKKTVSELIEAYPHVRRTGDRYDMFNLVEAHLEWLLTHNYSEATINYRRRFLYELMEWCGQRNIYRPSEINKPILERYQRYLFYRRKANGKRMSFRSQHSRVTSVRHWFKWLAQQDYLDSNPASELVLPRIETRLPRHVLTQGEVEAILNLPDIDTTLGLRDRAILETLYNTGIRRKELTNIKIGDVDASNGSLFIRQGKGKKDRYIPIGERAVAWVEKYLYEGREELTCGRDDNELFLSYRGEGLDPDNLSSLVSRYIAKANIGKTGSCHLFRHTMATLMLENGADLRFIQAMLGHVNLATTEIYTHVSIKKLKEIHALTHPGANLKRKQCSEGQEVTEADIMAELENESLEETESLVH